MKGLQAVLLAAVFLSPVALGAGEQEVLPSLAYACGKAAKTLSFKTSAESVVVSKPALPELTGAATLSVWNMNKAARRLLILRVESLKWP